MSRLIGLLFCLAVLSCDIGPAAYAQAPPLAVYKGNGDKGRSRVPAFETFMGRRVDAVGDFIDFASRAAFDNDVAYTASGWKGYDRPLILAVPVLCRGETFSDIAAGKQDGSYVRLAKTFNQAGVRLRVVRLGWEDNGQTTPGYASQDRAAHFANYKAAWRHLYGVLKPLLPDTLIVQDFALGWQQEPQSELFLPDVADGIGLTIYPQTWSPFTAEPFFTQNLMNESWGLKAFGSWYADKPIVITEYGPAGVRADGHGAPEGGDDPAWTRASLALLSSWGPRVVGVVVWDYHAGDFDGLVSDGSFPRSGAVLKEMFSDRGAAPRR